MLTFEERQSIIETLQNYTDQSAELAISILKNPGCTAWIDNDSWYLQKPTPDNIDDYTSEEQEKWYENDSIITQKSRDIYGRALLEALALIVNVEIEDV